jgi:CheY-like chemotaxis protein
MITDEKILNFVLIEDDEVDVMTVQRAFKQNKMTNPLHVAGNGEEGLELLRSGTVPNKNRVILLDLNMPRMNGLEFLRALRADTELHAATVIVFTTSNAEKDKIEAYDLNVAGYLLKPVSFAKFVELMATLNKYWTLVEFP